MPRVMEPQRPRGVSPRAGRLHDFAHM